MALLYFSPLDEEQAQANLEPPLLPPPAAELADYNWSVTSLDGQELRLADLKGKVIVINFWATWCPPCRAEMPSLQRLHEQTRNQGVVLLCISNETSSQVSTFIKKKGYTVPVYTITGDPPLGFQTRGIPTTFIVSADGKVAFKHIGEAKWDDPSVLAFIDQLK
jgi:thiol-disulfide isomerase/thioredoxin